jgi:hypothetical protein
MEIFGPDSKEIIFSGDAVQDEQTASLFVNEYGTMHRWRKMPDNSQILLVGADNFAFPIPLKEDANGKWFFDTIAGKDEILNRRIGRNELAIIEVCGAVSEAQAQYFVHLHDGEKIRQYAAKFISDPASIMACIGSPRMASPRVHLGRWQRLQPRRDTVQSPRGTRHSTVTTFIC